jgi:hypothetical protein
MARAYLAALLIGHPVRVLPSKKGGKDGYDSLDVVRLRMVKKGSVRQRERKLFLQPLPVLGGAEPFAFQRSFHNRIRQWRAAPRHLLAFQGRRPALRMHNHELLPGLCHRRRIARAISAHRERR